MLDSLAIKNYRNLKDLAINRLGKVNLITGKNNTGKSTVLEAVGIYATKGDLGFIYQLLEERGENSKASETKINYEETNIKNLSSIFADRIVDFENKHIISIGSVDNGLFGDELSHQDSVLLRFVRYSIPNDMSGGEVRRLLWEKDGFSEGYFDYKTGIEFKFGDKSLIIPLNSDTAQRSVYKVLQTRENIQFVRTRNIDRISNGRLWDGIALTEKERFVIDALKIIEPATERITFIEEVPGKRAAVIKLANHFEILPLRSMGDGINRILTIILALVNADNGFLLIDEFENGLHHTTQEKLWEVIFHLAQRLNVQVFATTHSEDCIAGFEHVLNNSGTGIDGKLIRLDNIDGVIKQVEFDGNELRIANENDIEIR